MSDRYVRPLGILHDIHGAPLVVAVDYDSVVIGTHPLERAACEEFGRLFVAACWEAADNARLMAEEGAQ